MSTRQSIALASIELVVGGETYHEDLHFYQDCFDDDGTVYLEVFQQGVFSNVTQTYTLPLDKAIALFTRLGEWARGQKEATDGTDPQGR